MSADGLFIHFLALELSQKLTKTKINKIYQPNPLEIVLQLRSNKETFQLLLCASLDAPRIYLTEQVFVNPKTPLNFCMLLRKYIERGIITKVSQNENDRVVTLTINTYNELGDNVNYNLIFELMGRCSNIILTTEDNTIIDAIRKVLPGDSTRYIIPKATYIYPNQENKVNPFKLAKENVLSIDNFQGLSKITQNEIKEYYNNDFFAFINQNIKPTIYSNQGKFDFYCFELNSLTKDDEHDFSSISMMLDYYYSIYKKTINSTNNDLIKQVKRLIAHQTTKLANLEDDLAKARENLKYKELGILLQANLYQAKKGMKEIIVQDFLNDGLDVTVSLDEKLDPSTNLKKIFAKGKKATNALVEVSSQINKTKEEIRYLEDILAMLEFATSKEIEEIKEDLLLNSEQYKFKNKKHNKKKAKIEIQHFNFENITIWIGKNNIQNDYLSNKLAKCNDYWFHVKNASGAHVVASVPQNSDAYKLSENEIRMLANLAGYFSKYSTSSSVPVDYTKIKYLKKIPGAKGYHVTYTNQKTIYIDPNYDLIKNYLRK